MQFIACRRNLRFSGEHV